MKRLLFIITFCMLAVTAQADDVVQVNDTLQVDDAAQASTVDYSYVRLGFTYETLPDELFGDAIFSGTGLDLSWAYNDRWALIGSHYSADSEDRFLIYNRNLGLYLPLRKVPQEYTGIGALYHRSLGADTDLQLALEAGELRFWHRTVFGYGTRSGNSSGARVSVGLSSKFFDRMEARLLWRHFEYKDSEAIGLSELDDTILEANYFFTEKYSAGVSYVNNDFTDRFAVNAGYAF